jgi:hypothetical protein
LNLGRRPSGRGRPAQPVDPVTGRSLRSALPEAGGRRRLAKKICHFGGNHRRRFTGLEPGNPVVGSRPDPRTTRRFPATFADEFGRRSVAVCAWAGSSPPLRKKPRRWRRTLANPVKLSSEALAGVSGPLLPCHRRPVCAAVTAGAKSPPLRSRAHRTAGGVSGWETRNSSQDSRHRSKTVGLQCFRVQPRRSYRRTVDHHHGPFKPPRDSWHTNAGLGWPRDSIFAEAGR